MKVNDVVVFNFFSFVLQSENILVNVNGAPAPGSVSQESQKQQDPRRSLAILHEEHKQMIN